MRAKFKTFTTISGREITVRKNESKRHFTIKTSAGTYRTLQMSKEEFNNYEYNTGNDWQQFLKSGSYYKLKS